jgi:hypothetical protein
VTDKIKVTNLQHVNYRHIFQLLFHCTMHTDVELYSFFNLGARWGCVVNTTPWWLYLKKNPSTHRTGHCVGLRTGIDRCGKSHPPPRFKPRTVQAVVNLYTNYATSAKLHFEFGCVNTTQFRAKFLSFITAPISITKFTISWLFQLFLLFLWSAKAKSGTGNPIYFIYIYIYIYRERERERKEYTILKPYYHIINNSSIC